MASAFAALEPVPAYLFPYLTAGFLSMGLATSGYFFMYENLTTKKTRSLVHELGIATVGSVTLGLGTLFFLLWSGVHI